MGLVQRYWREVALHEIVPRTFVLNFQGAKRPLTQSCRPVSWDRRGGFCGALFGDSGLKPDDIEMGCDGIAGDFAHVRWSAYETKDPYSDVVVHEVAHLLHYLKPSHYGCMSGGARKGS